MHKKLTDGGINNVMQTSTDLNNKMKFSVHYRSAARLASSFTMVYTLWQSQEK